jgi:tetrapyrrole methylase family protein / MazG family protein
LDQGLPALLSAYKVQRKAADLGFDWPQIDGALEKLREEAAELEDAYREGVPGRIEEEFGDFLFAAVNVARFLGVNPELALGKASRKFLSRFRYILEQVEQSGRPITEFTLTQLDRWWEEAKIEGKYN